MSELFSDRFTPTQREVITKGYSILDVNFDFTEADCKEVSDLFLNSPDDVVKISNTLQDVEDTRLGLTPGVGSDAFPRSMIQPPDSCDIGVLQKISAQLNQNDSLHWITGTRPHVKFSLLRSLPGTEAQFWHRDYCFKDRGVTQMFWDSMPLVFLVAIDDETYLDFPSGPVHIPRNHACLVRGDYPHRGKGNPNSKSLFRVFGSAGFY